jgi:hypothetical protein
MSSDDKTTEQALEGFSLKRWSRVKREAARAAAQPAAATPAALPQTTAASGGPSAPAAEPIALPPVESLNFESDFTAFLRPQVDEGLKRKALKQLFGNPHFNVMDGLDVYIDDYSKPDPLAPDIARALADAYSVLEPSALPGSTPSDATTTTASAESPARAEASDPQPANAPPLAEIDQTSSEAPDAQNYAATLLVPGTPPETR